MSVCAVAPTGSVDALTPSHACTMPLNAGPARPCPLAGYGQEAISYVVPLLDHGLVSPRDLWLSQSGDHADLGLASSGLPPSVAHVLRYNDQDVLRQVNGGTELAVWSCATRQATEQALAAALP